MKSRILLCLLLVHSITLASIDAIANHRTATSKPAEQVATPSNETLAKSITEATSSRRQNETASFATDGDELMRDSAPGLSLIDDDRTKIAPKYEEDQATSPTMTSVHHQVWTSSSSGSLDELSPELISKLRGDVPFLAAYALRPRLVGASSSPAGSSKQMEKDEDALSLQTSASQRSSLPLVAEPKLSDFNELKVETSSTSKSEHHHKRKTTLKKQPQNSLSGDSSKKRRLVLAATSKLMIERRRKGGKMRANTLGVSSGKKLKRGQKSRSMSAAGRLRSQASRLRSNLAKSNRRHHMSIIKHGRLQQAPISPALNKLPDGKTIASSTDTAGDDGEVKGGSKKSAGGNPFYKRRKEEAERKSAEEPATNDLDEAEKPGDTDRVEPTEREKNREVVEDNSDGGQLEPPEPRRVGEPDVDEIDGDTVTVTPKFDGVDDDPEIPIDDSETMPTGDDKESEGMDKTEEHESDSSQPAGEPEGAVEPRGKRVNRAKSEPGGPGTGSMVAGGGIGATIGATGEENSPDRVNADAGDNEGNFHSKPGVEFANKNDGKASDPAEKQLPSGRGQSGAEANGGQDEDGDSNRDTDQQDGGEAGESMSERPFDSRRVSSDSGGSSTNRDDTDDNQETSEGPRSNEAGKDADKDSGGDVDYRDEIEATRSGKGNSGGFNSYGVDSKRKQRPSVGHHGKEGDEGISHGQGGCDEHNHDHHDPIKWLQDAIPGEPGQDYPTLNRSNLSSFDCQDQKFPGYYADVEARCQVFHICQADGRQDSFLCPNGTIFSQISRVCVWWNSFDCEDAPKFYALNAQLYNNKKTVTLHPAADLRPLDGARIIPGDGGVSAHNSNDDEESSIDSLIKAMRRRQQTMMSSDDRHSLDTADQASLDENEEDAMLKQSRRFAAGRKGAEAGRGKGGLSSEDEASIQRKSTKLEVDGEEEEAFNRVGPSSSRLRHDEPRRKRRASVKHAPPKLRPTRRSNKRPKIKLRTVIKPKRRA